MDDNRLYKYYRNSRNSWHFWNNLICNFIVTDKDLRNFLNIGQHCGTITAITFFLLMIILIYTVTNWSVFLRNIKKFDDMHVAVEEKLPRKKNVLQVRPAYNCINKHIQQITIFLNKINKVLRKEQLEVEIMNSRLNTMSDLLNPEDKSQWVRTKSPKGYFREMFTPPHE